MPLIDVQAIVAQQKEQIKQQVSECLIRPTLAVVVVGQHPASAVYVRNKRRVCEEVGIHSILVDLPETVSQAKLEAVIKQLNTEKMIHAILIQLPLPGHLDESRLLALIDPLKDVDGFHPENVGALYAGNRTRPRPCTPSGVMRILASLGCEDLSGLNAVVVGRSHIVGKPMAQLLLEKNATVTQCHSRTRTLDHFLKHADLVVVAVGRPHFIQGHQLKAGAIIIDIGINRTKEGKLVGDVHTDSALEQGALITPVPRGCGLTTVATLMENTLLCYHLQQQPKKLTR